MSVYCEIAGVIKIIIVADTAKTTKLCRYCRPNGKVRRYPNTPRGLSYSRAFNTGEQMKAFERSAVFFQIVTIHTSSGR